MLLGTHLHLLVVGAGNPMVVPGMPWLGARHGESACCDLRDQHVSESFGTEGFYKYYLYIILLRAPISPAWPIRYVFFATKIFLETPSHLGRWGMYL
jgi:hypothetical protein